jgi:hypothetical protein
MVIGGSGMKKDLTNSLAGLGLSKVGRTTQLSGANLAKVKKARIPKLKTEVDPPLLPKKIKKSTPNYQTKTMEGFVKARTPKLM